jgi:hypothetical protein
MTIRFLQTLGLAKSVRVFGFNREKAVHTAVDRLIENAKSQNCNCLEIGRVTMKSFLGLPFTRVSAHCRQRRRETC